MAYVMQVAAAVSASTLYRKLFFFFFFCSPFILSPRFPRPIRGHVIFVPARTSLWRRYTYHCTRAGLRRRRPNGATGCFLHNIIFYYLIILLSLFPCGRVRTHAVHLAARRRPFILCCVYKARA